MKYLIDTDWIIHYLNGNEKIIEKIDSFNTDGLAISVISLAEVYEGVYYSTKPDDNKNALRDFLTEVIVLDVNEDICKKFAKERGRLRKEGQLIGNFDILIASVALHYNLTLLTNNKKHFERIDGLNFIST